jgi:serine/threonine protein kinase
VEEVLRLGRDLAAALAHLHAHGLVHRDLKPANLWLQIPGARLKILDFGLARFLHDDVTLTKTGTIMGTPAFMSPEQARGETVDHRSDLFSFGCILYTLSAGVDPFHANTTTATLTALATQDPCAVHNLNPAIPRPLSDLIAQLLAKNPNDRPASAAAVLQQLQRIEAAPAPQQQPQRFDDAQTLMTLQPQPAPGPRQKTVNIQERPANNGGRTERLSAPPRSRKRRRARGRRPVGVAVVGLFAVTPASSARCSWPAGACRSATRQPRARMPPPFFSVD